MPKQCPVCRWCGGAKQSVGNHHDPVTKKRTVGFEYRCRNPDCPRRGQVPWRVPRTDRIVFARPPYDDQLSFDDVVRAIEDFQP